MNYSTRNITRNRTHFWMSFWSIFIVALCTLVVKTLIANGPLIFLKMAESNIGQYDFLVFPATTDYDDTKLMYKYTSSGHFLDFLKVIEI
jgi:hypothetical protein